MSFIVATNVVASRPPEHQLTGPPHARSSAEQGQHPSVNQRNDRKLNPSYMVCKIAKTIASNIASNMAP